VTQREQQILQLIEADPMISQQQIADAFGITRSSAAVHISNLMKKGYIAGKGYVLGSGSYVAVVGGVNIYCEDVLIGRADLVAENNVEPNFLLYSLKKMKDFVFGRVFAVGMLLSVISVSAYLHISSKNSRYKKVGTVRYNKFS